jgi:hypothetical protein
MVFADHPPRSAGGVRTKLRFTPMHEIVPSGPLAPLGWGSLDEAALHPMHEIVPSGPLPPLGGGRVRERGHRFSWQRGAHCHCLDSVAEGLPLVLPAFSCSFTSSRQVPVAVKVCVTPSLVTVRTQLPSRVVWIIVVPSRSSPAKAPSVAQAVIRNPIRRDRYETWNRRMPCASSPAALTRNRARSRNGRFSAKVSARLALVGPSAGRSCHERPARRRRGESGGRGVGIPRPLRRRCSVLPSALSVNPSLTIGAVAERVARLIVTARDLAPATRPS